MLSSRFFPNWKVPSKNTAQIALKIFFLVQKSFLVEQSRVAAVLHLLWPRQNLEKYISFRRDGERWRELLEHHFGQSPLSCAGSPVLETRTVPGWCRGVGLVPIHSWVEATAEGWSNTEKTQSAGKKWPKRREQGVNLVAKVWLPSLRQQNLWMDTKRMVSYDQQMR